MVEVADGCDDPRPDAKTSVNNARSSILLWTNNDNTPDMVSADQGTACPGSHWLTAAPTEP